MTKREKRAIAFVARLRGLAPSNVLREMWLGDAVKLYDAAVLEAGGEVLEEKQEDGGG